MKKFYESPVVEITVFDVEDVITTSVKNVNDMTVDELNTFTAAVEQKYQANNVIVSDYNSYNW